MTHCDCEGDMVQVATVGSKGQIVIPHKMREKFAINPGDQVLFMVKDAGFISLVKMENMQQMIDQMQVFLDGTE